MKKFLAIAALSLALTGCERDVWNLYREADSEQGAYPKNKPFLLEQRKKKWECEHYLSTWQERILERTGKLAHLSCVRIDNGETP